MRIILIFTQGQIPFLLRFRGRDEEKQLLYLQLYSPDKDNYQ